MNLSDYILLSKEERQRHINLESKCILINRPSWQRRKKDLLAFLGVNDNVSRWAGKISRCHLCANHTNSGKFVCVNPEHIYIGDQRENNLDRPPELAGKGGRGNLGNRGFKHDLERLSRNRKKGMVKVRVDSVDTGESATFLSIKFAAFSLGIGRNTVMRNLKRDTPNPKGWLFSRENEGH